MYKLAVLDIDGTLIDNKGNISSLASTDYVSAAHAKGMKVWGLVNDFDEKKNNINIKKILGRTSIRTNLINNLVTTAMSYNLDGINVDFEKIGVSYAGFKPGQVRQQINDMTSIIEKSVYDFDIWVQRGCNYGGMDKFFNIPMSELRYASQAELEQLLLGKMVTEYGFCSAGVSKGKGFSHCPIILNIYAPKGTQMMYAEPFSAFGNGSGKSWNGLKKQSNFGQEAEIILQQGTSFRITKIEKSNDKLYFDIEVIEQKPQR